MFALGAEVKTDIASLRTEVKTDTAEPNCAPTWRPGSPTYKRAWCKSTIRTLLDLQAEYQAWLDNLPASLQESALAEKLEQVCALDLVELESVELPHGFGRD